MNPNKLYLGTLILYRADGAVHTELCPATVVDDRVFLDKLQQLVGGYIEIVWVLYNGKRTAMIVNEDGLSLGSAKQPRHGNLS